jgi:hypothetical protein
MTPLRMLLLGIQSLKRLGVVRELSRIVVKSQEVCIALLFVINYSENQFDLGDDLVELGLKEIWPFMNTSTET